MGHLTMPPNDTVVKVLLEHISRDYECGVGVKGWRRLPEIPAAREIIGPVNSSQSDSNGDCSGSQGSNSSQGWKLPINIVDKAWCNTEEYVGAHYQLLREDAIAPLRRAVELYRAQPTMKDNEELSIYTHVSRST